MTKCIYLAWQDQITKGWHVIGRLLRIDERFEFRYTQGVKNVSNFSLLPSMPNHEEVYRSNELFSLFKNRLMPKSRPDYGDYVRWMGLTTEESEDELVTLAISGGEKETDFFRIIPVPEKKDNGDHSFKFFVNGISHMPELSKELVNSLNQGDQLLLMEDFQNQHDAFALMLRTVELPVLVGFIPAYLTKIIVKLKEEKGADAVMVKVFQVNTDAPFQKRLLCSLSLRHPIKPWDQYEDEYKIIAI